MNTGIYDVNLAFKEKSLDVLLATTPCGFLYGNFIDSQKNIIHLLGKKAEKLSLLFLNEPNFSND